MPYERYYRCLFQHEKPYYIDVLKNEYKIKIDEYGMGKSMGYFFYIPEDHPRIDELLQILPEECENSSTFISYISFYKFPTDDKEINQYEWFSISSVFNKIVPKNRHKIWCSNCRRKVKIYTGLEDYIDLHPSRSDYPIITSQKINWRNKFFCADEIDSSQIFCSAEARNIFDRSGIVGIDYKTVYKRTMEPRSDIFEIRCIRTIDESAIVPYIDMELYSCPQCGMRQLRVPNGIEHARPEYAIINDCIEKCIDCYVTPPIINEGNTEIIISRKMLRTIRENKMDRSLDFFPIRLV